MITKEKLLDEVINYAQNNKNIEAALLTSSMANPKVKTDQLSDLDIVFITNDPNLFILK